MFRKAYQAWNKRERTRRKAVQPPCGTAAVVGQAAVQQAEATPVKRRRMLPRPNRADFDTEEDFEDAMAERGAARDLRRRDTHAQAEAERRERLRSGDHAAEFADREADRKRGARRLATALAEAQKPKSDAARIDPAVRRRLHEQQDLIFSLEELLEPWACCYFDSMWFDTHLFDAVVAWAHQHEPDGSDAWEDELIVVAADSVRRRFSGPLRKRQHRFEPVLSSADSKWAGTDSNAWVGDIEFSLDSGSTWIYPPCISGCIGSYAISDAISSYGSTVIVDMDTDNPMDGTQCLGGTRCIFALI